MLAYIALALFLVLVAREEPKVRIQLPPAASHANHQFLGGRLLSGYSPAAIAHLGVRFLRWQTRGLDISEKSFSSLGTNLARRVKFLKA